MNLLPEHVKQTIPPLSSTYGVSDPMIWVKFFAPWTYWTWYVVEYDPKDKVFYGLVNGLEQEYGYFFQSELEKVEGPFGLRIERDLYFIPQRASRIRNNV